MRKAEIERENGELPQEGYNNAMSRTATMRTFDVRIPNALTARTLHASRAGKNVKRFGSKKELFGGWVESLKEARAIRKGKLRPGRVFRVEARRGVRRGEVVGRGVLRILQATHDLRRKAPGHWRTPRRQHAFRCARKREASWTAVVLYRF